VPQTTTQSEPIAPRTADQPAPQDIIRPLRIGILTRIRRGPTTSNDTTVATFLATFALGGGSPADARMVSKDDAVFVGQASELHVLDKHLTRALAGERRHGVGRRRHPQTRMLREFTMAARARAASTLAGTAGFADHARRCRALLRHLEISSALSSPTCPEVTR
jgi:hypothetical protein